MSTMQQSIDAANALVGEIIGRWPQHTKEIKARQNSYVRNLCGVAQEPTLSAEQIISAGRQILDNWKAEGWKVQRFPEPGDFLLARDERVTIGRDSRADSSVAISKAVSVGKKAWEYDGYQVLGTYYAGLYQSMLRNLSDYDRAKSQALVSVDVARMKSHGIVQVRDRVEVKKKVGGFKKLPVIPGINAPTADNLANGEEAP